MYTRFENIELGKEYILCESGCRVHVRALSNPHNNHPERSCDWLGVELLAIKENREFDVGYNTNYPAYAPALYTIEELDKYMAPELLNNPKANG